MTEVAEGFFIKLLEKEADVIASKKDFGMTDTMLGSCDYSKSKNQCNAYKKESIKAFEDLIEESFKLKKLPHILGSNEDIVLH